MIELSEIDRLKCSIFSSRVICVTIILIILCMCLCMISIQEYEEGPLQIYSSIRCNQVDTLPLPLPLPLQETPEPEVNFVDLRGGDALEVIEGFENMTEDNGKNDYNSSGGVHINGVRYGKSETQIKRRFELVAKSNESNTAMNLLFGEGEFIFTKEKLNVFMMASLYTIGANLYAAKDESQVSKLHYNVYIGDENKNLKGRLGEMRRSLDGRYKLELLSRSKDFINFVAENSYIVVKLEDSDGTLRQTLLESFY